MKKMNGLMGFILAILVSAQSASALQLPRFTAQELASTESCVVPKVDGERVPFPLQKANTKFNLSENETYLLNGSLMIMNGQIYFRVDFTSQPWLATQKMVEFPYFVIESISNGTVKRMAGRPVQVAVIARTIPESGMGADAKMKLQSILPPVSL